MAFAFNIAGFIGGFVDQSNKIREQQDKESRTAIAKAAQGETVRHNKATEDINYYKMLTGGAMSPKDQALTRSRNANATYKENANSREAERFNLLKKYDPRLGGTKPGGDGGPDTSSDEADAIARSRDARGTTDGPGPAIPPPYSRPVDWTPEQEGQSQADLDAQSLQSDPDEGDPDDE